MDFMLVLLQTSKKVDSKLVVVNRFSRMAYLIPCLTNVDAFKAAKLLFKEVV